MLFNQVTECSLRYKRQKERSWLERLDEVSDCHQLLLSVSISARCGHTRGAFQITHNAASLLNQLTDCPLSDCDSHPKMIQIGVVKPRDERGRRMVFEVRGNERDDLG